MLFETASTKEDQEEDDKDSDDEDLAEADEDDSDLDLAWKMLDIARAIVEKRSGNTMEQVDILSALADVALERGLYMHASSPPPPPLFSFLNRHTHTHRDRKKRVMTLLKP